MWKFKKKWQKFGEKKYTKTFTADSKKKRACKYSIRKRNDNGNRDFRERNLNLTKGRLK